MVKMQKSLTQITTLFSVLEIKEIIIAVGPKQKMKNEIEDLIMEQNKQAYGSTSAGS